MALITYMLIGLVAGIIGGGLGLGGGAIMVPALIMFAGLTQHQAQGTALAVIPLSVFAAIKYYQSGNLNLAIAAMVALGFAVGTWAGASWAQHIPAAHLKKVFGLAVIFIGLKMFIK